MRPRGRFGALETLYERAFWRFHAAEARSFRRAFQRRARTVPLPLEGRPLRVAFLIEGDIESGLSPAARLRLGAYLPHLAREGIEASVYASEPPKYFTGTHEHVARPWLSRSFREIHGLLEQERNRLRDLLQATEADLVYLQRDLQQAAWSRLESVVPIFHDRIVFDFDDAIFLRPSHAMSGDLVDTTQEKKIEHVIRMASTVIVSTPYLEEHVRRIHGRVVAIPTPIDLEHFRPADRAPSNTTPVVGWIGTAANLSYLRDILPPLDAVAKGRPFILRVMSEAIPERSKLRLGNAVCEHVPWSVAAELPFLQSLDVGLMPLPDDAWTRGKAGFKLIQYMACGVATIASPVGYNRYVVGEPGVTSLLATSPAEWTECLDALLADAERRRRMGEQGRQRVTELFDIRTHARTLAVALQDTARRRSFAGLAEDARRGSSVLLVADTLDDGRAWTLASDMAARGDRPVLLSRTRHDWPAREEKAGVVIVRIDETRPPFPFKSTEDAVRAFLERHGRSFDQILDLRSPASRRGVT